MQSHANFTTCFEALEPRQLRSADTATPTDTTDYHLSLNGDGSVVQTATAAQNTRAPLSQFQWFDGTHLTELAPMSNGAINPAECQGWYVWPSMMSTAVTRDSEPDEANVRFRTRQAVASGVKVVVIDNETWKFDIRYSTRAEVDHTIQRMVKVFTWMHDEAPELKIGLYGYMSQSDDTHSAAWSVGTSNAVQGSSYWQYVLADIGNSFAAWQATSEYLRPLSKVVDYIFPALYTGTTSESSWADTARSTIEDSRRFGKPVIPFLMPYYHPGIGAPLANTELPPDVWSHELDVVQQYADGAFIWTAGAVNASDPWVTTTLAHANPTQAQRALSLQSDAASPATEADGQDYHSRFSDLQIDGATTSLF